MFKPLSTVRCRNHIYQLFSLITSIEILAVVACKLGRKRYIDDPNQVKPEPDHWDEEEDGIWRPPKVPNPAYKGPRKRKKVKNPNYKGKWKTPWIDNPEFEDDPDLYVLRPTKYVGIKIWQAEKEGFEEAGKVRKAREKEECQRAREEGEKRRRDRDTGTDIETTQEDHKLCGYFLTAVKIKTSCSPYSTKVHLPLNSQCYIAGDSSNVHFVSDNDVVLTPIEEKRGEVVVTKKRSRIGGMVHGSLSMVRQLHKLVMGKCLKVAVRVVDVFERGGEGDDDGEEVRVVVMVDVYLPIVLWSGWQFTKSGLAAAALFRHVR
ncbi:Calreticulin-3 [Capsicum baccatum]|uniref:Calreticulin-3 n=1 Tax=Capsicum baccatum TaxID=33114 RepID=A0A2G2V0A9_CAPBA|nr:Calreticulin-3 [Capsicum baccatum]